MNQKNIFTGAGSDWYKDALIYELHVRAFSDSNGDGVGDFCGLTSRLDYLQDLGVTAIWLLPFFPSPLRDDGYDIADYNGVHPAYGTLEDFQVFLDAAHERDMRVIIELVLNHTSDQHPWFQRARRAERGSPERDFYVWSDTPERYTGARVIFQDYEHSNWAWDPLAEQYYWHRFYAHQPDLNYDNPAVREAIFAVVDQWLEMGVDGLRLDAVPYLYERDGTPSENLLPTHRFLKELRLHIDARFADRMLLAEANQWPEDAVAYFGNGDECHMAFHFPLMPRLFMALRSEDRFPIVDIMAQTPLIPQSCQWALFLRNHDELTLEMVTEEERIGMYRAYAHNPEARINLGIRRRLAPLLGNNRRQIELLNGLLMALPGTPVIYYGDEIGMGDNIYLGDRNGVRTPMQWSADRNAGFSRANPQQLYLPLITDYEYHHEALHVEALQHNPHSLLNWMKRLFMLRRRFTALGRGSLRFLEPDNQKVLAFLREHGDETILVVANLSRTFQHVSLNLEGSIGYAPVELFGQMRLPPISAEPYVLTLGPHAFHWFSLQPEPVTTRDPTETPPAQLLPELYVNGPWQNLLRGNTAVALTRRLPAFLQSRNWFSQKDRPVLATHIVESVALPDSPNSTHLVIVEVEFSVGEPERYNLPLACTTDEQTGARLIQAGAVIARIRSNDGSGVLYDAMADPEVASALLEMMVQQSRLDGVAGVIVASVDPAVQEGRAREPEAHHPALITEPQNNTSLCFDELVVLKLYRRLDEGINPEVEIDQLLERRGFAYAPTIVGTLTYSRGPAVPLTLAVLHRMIPNRSTLWEYTLELLGRFYNKVSQDEPAPLQAHLHAANLIADLKDAPAQLSLAMESMPGDLIGLIGRRTAELHTTLADPDDPAFAPEPFTSHYQRSLYQSFRGLTGRVLRTLRASLANLPDETKELARQILIQESAILARFKGVLNRRLPALRIRCHGDYHLGQLLWTGEDVMIIDFEGEPGTSVLERRLKRCPLWDVAGMVQSFAYVSQVALAEAAHEQEADLNRLEPWATAWHRQVSSDFVRAYLATGGDTWLPQNSADLVVLLDAYLMYKAVYALSYELNHRPEWIPVALRCIMHLLSA